jgi:hypothetical protein
MNVKLNKVHIMKKDDTTLCGLKMDHGNSHPDEVDIVMGQLHGGPPPTCKRCAALLIDRFAGRIGWWARRLEVDPGDPE